MLPLDVDPNQSLFWSGTNSIVEELSFNDYGVKLVTSANAVSAKIINDMKITSWCGKKSTGTCMPPCF